MTDAAVQAWFHSVINPVPTDLENQVSKIMKEHKYIPDNEDPVALVYTYVHGGLADLRRLAGATCRLWTRHRLIM